MAQQDVELVWRPRKWIIRGAISVMFVVLGIISQEALQQYGRVDVGIAQYRLWLGLFSCAMALLWLCYNNWVYAKTIMLSSSEIRIGRNRYSYSELRITRDLDYRPLRVGLVGCLVQVSILDIVRVGRDGGCEVGVVHRFYDMLYPHYGALRLQLRDRIQVGQFCEDDVCDL